MLLFPAIDLIEGMAVRLYQGDYSQQQTFGNDPAAFAEAFQKKGATHLHLVDLEGAKAGRPCNQAAVKKILEKTNVFTELGGGLRTEKDIENSFAMGVDRVILGTSALKDPAFTKQMVDRFKEKIAVGVDARDGKVAVEGWLSTSETDSVDFCLKMREIGVRYIIYTDISRDGTGTGANLEIYRQLSDIDGLHITASGGVSTLEDIAALRQMGLYAAIIGKALYTGGIDLGQAICLAGVQEEGR
ncbi:1-(5-phosphoribosyl)-5-[(5-phosphoribosylamino)methylideneamino]imidazole-4-carboxamide isomerase [Ruminococcaceae bacterium OttesenSCG-928-I18]|nr:1-(5-phosphoribosyl)-5-[(5-phosphoribosylamino)methylideneamino]imidazole-4-carboxamide isomerase [Ruminococcaceae bacterium OttesenSCG-928-I18]